MAPDSTGIRPPPPVRDLAWEPGRASQFGARALALWEELLSRLPDLPVTGRWRDADVRAGVAREVPDEPLPDDELFDYLRAVAFDWSMYPGHPRFMAYISGAGTVPGAPAELLAAALNMNLGGWRLAPSATEIELQVVRFFADLFGFPETARGLMTSGGAMANFIALKAARDHRAGWDIREAGVQRHPRLAVYASEEVHVVTDRAADMLGLGTSAVRKVPVDERFRMDGTALRRAVERDLDAGDVRPIAVVASAGTVATGAVDPLEEIADVCARHQLWMHVDGAYGGPALLALDLRPLFSGIERADSVAFDPHKWLYVPHSAGCVVVRNEAHLEDSFITNPAYTIEDKELTGHGTDFASLGPQFSRGFQALKVWVSLLAHGRRAYARRISHDAELARYMGSLVAARADFELATPVSLSICCFRFVPPDLAGNEEAHPYLDRLNERLMTAIQLDGRAYVSNAVLHDRFVLRACIVNFRTEAEDIEATLDVAAELGAELDRELRPSVLSPGASQQRARAR
jgi:aromatic-L-amino-acid decarboxylase